MKVEEKKFGILCIQSSTRTPVRWLEKCFIIISEITVFPVSTDIKIRSRILKSLDCNHRDFEASLHKSSLFVCRFRKFKRKFAFIRFRTVINTWGKKTLNDWKKDERLRLLDYFPNTIRLFSSSLQLKCEFVERLQLKKPLIIADTTVTTCKLGFVC